MKTWKSVDKCFLPSLNHRCPGYWSVRGQVPVYLFFRDGEGAGQVGRAPILFYSVAAPSVSASVVLFSVTIKCFNVFICFYLFIPIPNSYTLTQNKNNKTSLYLTFKLQRSCYLKIRIYNLFKYYIPSNVFMPNLRSLNELNILPLVFRVMGLEWSSDLDLHKNPI